nr:uncharacterized protein YcaQ-like [Nerophis lumbriciformis]
MSVSLSPVEARKLVLNCQRVVQVERRGRAIDATLSALQHLGYIQIDTISVVARAHHHTLWVRNPRYREIHLDKLLANRKIFEYWSHAAAYLPMQDYRHALPRMQLEKSRKGHWHSKSPKLMRQVLKRIENEGPLSARDFEDTGGRRQVWERKPAKYALEQLFMEGVVMTTARKGFQKIYDLTENVLPADVDRSMPGKQEHARFLVERFLQAHGLGKTIEFSHLRQGFKADIAQAVTDMHEAGTLLKVESCGEQWFALSNALEALEHPISRASVRIMSPFDNLVILRKRMQSLFDFDYQIECYLPDAKRRFGYFSLPVLWQGSLLARMDCKAHRKDLLLEIRHLAIESSVKKTQGFLEALSKEVWKFARFNGCDSIQLQRVSMEQVDRPKLQSALKRLIVATREF